MDKQEAFMIAYLLGLLPWVFYVKWVENLTPGKKALYMVYLLKGVNLCRYTSKARMFWNTREFRAVKQEPVRWLSERATAMNAAS